MTDTTPDYAGLIAEAEAAQEWMRQPDWADNFSLGDLAGWLRQRPTSILPRITSALRALLERNAALERKFTVEWTLHREALNRAEAAEAKLAEAMKVIEPFALVAEHDIGESESDTDLFRAMSDRYCRAPLLTVGDFRRARTALGTTQTGEGER